MQLPCMCFSFFLFFASDYYCCCYYFVRFRCVLCTATQFRESSSKRRANERLFCAVKRIVCCLHTAAVWCLLCCNVSIATGMMKKNNKRDTHTHANSKIGGKFAFNRPHEIHLTQICLPMRLSCCLLFLSILFFFWILFARLPQLPLCFGIFTFYLHAFCDLNNSLPANTLIFLFLLLCCRFRVCRCNYACITFCFRWFVDLMVCCTYGNDWSRTRWAHAFKNLSLQILLLMHNFKTDVDLCLLFLLFSVDCTCNQNWNDFH